MRTPELERIIDEHAPDPKRRGGKLSKSQRLFVVASLIASITTAFFGSLAISNSSYIGKLEDRISSLESRLNDFDQSQPIVEYDASRSRVLPNCTAGGLCSVEFRLRRTKFGEACGIPTVDIYIVDSRDIIRRAQLADMSYPVRATTQWGTIGLSFIAPLNVEAGKAILFEDLEFPGCNSPEGAPIRERTISLPFFIEPKR